MQLKDPKAGMLTKKITIQNKLGLHARAASKLVAVASRFGAEVTLHKDDLTANAKSIMGLMMLAARYNTEITLTTAEGNDAEAALEAIISLINQKFGEAE